MVLVLWLVFRASSYLAFYVFFEFSLVPIFLLVLGWGYQPERLPAAIRLVIYTVCASLPLFLIVVCLLHSPAGRRAPVEGKGLIQALT
jgi:NADH-ubiquinone oxidoreductase chain 4